MNSKIYTIIMITLMTTGCIKNNNAPLIEKHLPPIQNRQFSAEALWSMGRMGNVSINPLTGDALYQVTYFSVEQNKSNTELFFLANEPEAQARQITRSACHENSPQWVDDKTVLFLSDASGSSQLWQMNIDGSACKQISNFEQDIEGFALSPDGKKILFAAQVKTIRETKDIYPDLPKASGRIVNDLMYKHWDEWTETAPHPFVAHFDGNAISDIKDLLEGEPYESPMKPFGGMEQLCWAPDSRHIAYTCRKKTGIDYAISTNSDIYLYDLETGETRNLTEGMHGYDTNPQFSPDGRRLAWLSMERDGYESDQNRLFVMDMETGEKHFVSSRFQSNVDEFAWLNDDEIVFAGCWHALEHLYLIDLDGEVRELTDGQYDYQLAGLFGTKVFTLRHSMREANELFAFDIKDLPAAAEGHEDVYYVESSLERKGILKQLTFENKHIYDAVDMGSVVPRWQTTTDGKRMLTWIIYPPHFDPSKKYPTLLYCEGGPQSPVSQFWSYRWNFMRMAAHDYIIVAPNRRGLPGFGIEWNEQISGDYGGQCMKDYFTAIDEFCNEPYVDRDHLGCVGASFGGFSVYWLAGHHNKRFKAFIAHDGIFNMEMQYLETEEKWFANWDMGGAYWEKNNKTAQRTFANSPHLFVDKWDTPILCIHGEKDYRILANQGMAAFDAAKMRGVPAELLIFPDENHWVLKPQNGILWQREFIGWLDKWLK